MSDQIPQGYNYNSYSSGQVPAAPAAPVRPKQVDLSFWLLIASLVLSVVGIPMGIAAVNSPAYRAQLESITDQAAGGLDMDAAIATATIMLVVIGILSVAVSLLIAIFIRKGHNWARFLLAVFAGLSLLNLVDLSLANLTPILATLLTLTATILLFLAPVPAYFKGMKQYRQAKKFNYGA